MPQVNINLIGLLRGVKPRNLKSETFIPIQIYIFFTIISFA